MTEEWRVSVVFTRRGAMKRYQLHGMLRSSLHDDITISAGQRHIYLYVATAEAAQEAERATVQALTELGLNEECRLERWDTSSQEWRDVRSGLAIAERKEPPTLGGVAGKVADAVAGVVVESFLEGH